MLNAYHLHKNNYVDIMYHHVIMTDDLTVLFEHFQVKENRIIFDLIDKNENLQPKLGLGF